MKLDAIYLPVLLSVGVVFLSSPITTYAEEVQQSDVRGRRTNSTQLHIIIKDFLKIPYGETLTSKTKDSETLIQNHVLISDYQSEPAATDGVAMLNIEQSLGENDGFNATWQSVRSFALMKPLKKPLKLYVDRRSPLFKAKYLTFVEEGLDQWKKALEGRLTYAVVSNHEDADILLYWVKGFAEANEAGLTDITIGKASIQIKTAEMPDNILRGNILHELGHALGIEGHSKNNNDIMTAEHQWKSSKAYDDFNSQLSAGDIRAIQTLYSKQWKAGQDLYNNISSK